MRRQFATGWKAYRRGIIAMPRACPFGSCSGEPQMAGGEPDDSPPTTYRECGLGYSSFRAACAAASRAIGTRNGEQLT